MALNPISLSIELLKISIYVGFRYPHFFNKSSCKNNYFKDHLLINEPITKKFYSNLTAVGFVNKWFESVHHRKMSEIEQEKTFYYTLLWTLQDEYTEEPELAKHPNYIPIEKPISELLDLVANKSEFIRTKNQLLIFQADSDRQKDPSVSIEKLTNIARNKSSYSMLFYASMFDWKPLLNQQEILSQYGICVQHTDDVMDIYWDLHENIHTLANSYDLLTFESFYLTQIQNLLKLLNELPNQQKATNLSLISVAVGLVQIDRLKKLIKENPAKNYQDFDRKQMICDMAKIQNWFSFFKVILTNRH